MQRSHFLRSFPMSRRSGFQVLRGWMLIAGCLLARSAFGASANQVDYQLKAGYLYNFAKFIEWPPPPLPDHDAFRVGVLGDGKACAIIAETLRGKSVGNHTIEVVLINAPADIATCRVVFIPRNAGISPAELRAHAPKAAVLLVGEKENFASDGGDIGFVPRGDNLRYQVNLVAAQTVGLRLSARLAGLAEIVRSSAP